MFEVIFILTLGLLMLITGAELLVRGSLSLAHKLKITPLAVGLTVVAIGTSAPEIIINILSALNNNSDVGIGNIIGSNIANVLLILGIASLIRPLKFQNSTLNKDIPFILLITFFLLIIGVWDFFDKSPFMITRFEGITLLGAFTFFIWYTFGKNSGQKKQNLVVKKKNLSVSISILFIFISLLFLFGGGRIMTEQAIYLAKILGVSEATIGLTVVAIGTSLPELIISAIAAFHKEKDLLIGNIVGSNIINITLAIGLASVILPVKFNYQLTGEVIISAVAIVLLFLGAYVGKPYVVGRRQGTAFLALYIIYISYLVYKS